METLRKRGYSKEDGEEILKIGKALGIQFCTKRDAERALRQVEVRDKSFSFSFRASRRSLDASLLMGWKRFFKILYSRRNLSHPVVQDK